MEFTDNDNSTFVEVMRVLETHSKFQEYKIQKKAKLSLQGLEIYPEQRKVCCNKQEICLTVKEYDLLYILAINKGHVLTYAQIYEEVWRDVSSGGEKTAIGFHVCNLRKKIYKVLPNAPFAIRCVREVGYCLENNFTNSTQTV